MFDRRTVFFVAGKADQLTTKYIVYYLGVAQFGSALEWGSRGRKFKSSHSDHNGQLTQLVECLRHMEEARGSSPLLPTT